MVLPIACILARRTVQLPKDMYISEAQQSCVITTCSSLATQVVADIVAI